MDFVHREADPSLPAPTHLDATTIVALTVNAYTRPRAEADCAYYFHSKTEIMTQTPNDTLGDLNGE